MSFVYLVCHSLVSQLTAFIHYITFGGKEKKRERGKKKYIWMGDVVEAVDLSGPWNQETKRET